MTSITTNPRQGGYLAKKCFELAAKDNQPTRYPAELKAAYSAAVQGRMDSGNTFEDHIGQRLIDDGATGVVIISEARTDTGERTATGKAGKERDTFAAYLNPAVHVIFNARIGGVFEQVLSEYLGTPVTDTLRISEPDMIELGPVMGNGLRAMRFVDVKDHKTCTTSTSRGTYPMSPLSAPYFGGSQTIALDGVLQRDDWMQLAHYYRHAHTLGLTTVDDSLWGAVIGREQVLVWARIDEARYTRVDPNTGKRAKRSALSLYDEDFAYGHQVVANARARELDPTVVALTAPEWKSDCAECPWKAVCLQELREVGTGGDISLLPGITPDRAVPYRAAGIGDIATLARHPLGMPLVGVKDATGAIRQARVTLSGIPHRAEGVTALDVPRADIEVDFDCESERTVYMWGVRTLDRTGADEVADMRWFDDYTDTDTGERDAFINVWAYFQELITSTTAAGKTISFYHYSPYERTQMRKLAVTYSGHPGVPTESSVTDFYESELVIDLLAPLKKDLVWPTMGHSIKALAPFVGFSWRDATPGGDVSMLWYRQGVSAETSTERTENIDRLRRYNEDDVAAQLALRAWCYQDGVGSPMSGACTTLPQVASIRGTDQAAA